MQIADRAGMSHNNTSRQLCKLTGQGYIWRKRVRSPAEFKYKSLKLMGERVLEELWIRNRLRDETGDPKIFLNLQKPLPMKHLDCYDFMKKVYFSWRWHRG